MYKEEERGQLKAGSFWRGEVYEGVGCDARIPATRWIRSHPRQSSACCGRLGNGACCWQPCVCACVCAYVYGKRGEGEGGWMWPEKTYEDGAGKHSLVSRVQTASADQLWRHRPLLGVDFVLLFPCCPFSTCLFPAPFHPLLFLQAKPALRTGRASSGPSGVIASWRIPSP